MKILLFSLSICSIGQAVEQVLKELELPYTEYIIDSDKRVEKLASTYKICSVPTIIIIDNNTEIERIVSYKNKKQLREQLSKYSK